MLRGISFSTDLSPPLKTCEGPHSNSVNTRIDFSRISLVSNSRDTGVLYYLLLDPLRLVCLHRKTRVRRKNVVWFGVVFSDCFFFLWKVKTVHLDYLFLLDWCLSPSCEVPGKFLIFLVLGLYTFGINVCWDLPGFWQSSGKESCGTTYNY